MPVLPSEVAIKNLAKTIHRDEYECDCTNVYWECFLYSKAIIVAGARLRRS